MTQVIEDFVNFAAGMVGGVIHAIPEVGTQQYWIMLGALLVLLGLLMVWLLVRLHRARVARNVDAVFAPEVTFDDISAQAAADSPAMAAQEVSADALPTASAETLATTSATTSATTPATTSATTSGSESEPVAGFRFFKKKAKTADAQTAMPTTRSADDIDDDIYLLGLEQEMLATRQLYLDGLITKEVYVTETRALYDKAQNRMT